MSVFTRRGHRSMYHRGLQALLILNALDAVFTSWWVGAGWAGEANPVMAHVLALGVGPFIAIKLAVGMAVGVIFRAQRAPPPARTGLPALVPAHPVGLRGHLHAGTSH